MGHPPWPLPVKTFLRLPVLSVFVIVAFWNTLISSQRLASALERPDPGPSNTA